MPVAGGVHDQIAPGSLGHHLHRLGEGCVVDSEMLHGIQMKAHSKGNELLGPEVQSAGSHGLLVVGPVSFQMVRVMGD